MRWKPLRLAVLPLIILFHGTPTLAQETERIGNIWDGVAHEPAAGPLREAERSARLLRSPTRERRLDDEVERLARELQERSAGPTGLPP